MVSLADVESAAKRLDGKLSRTPVARSALLSERLGSDVHLKLENLQRTGSFKLRGATNKILSLSAAERKRGVVAASAGNHAQGVAYAARDAGVPATIVMPEDAPMTKVAATARYGAEVVLHGRDYNEAYDKAREVEKKSGRVFVHAFDDPLVIAGQGTIALEILREKPETDTILVGIGGGGLCAGVAIAAKAVKPDVKIVAVEAAGASSLSRSLEAKKVVTLDRVDTIADGLATRRIGDITFGILREKVDEVVTVSDDEIANAILHLLENEKTVVEGAGAVPVAALLSGRATKLGRHVVALVSGGNIDVTLLSHIIDRGLAASGRYLKFRTVLPDRPGSLKELLAKVATLKGNIASIEHDRRTVVAGVGGAVVELGIETKGPEHLRSIVDALAAAGYRLDLVE